MEKSREAYFSLLKIALLPVDLLVFHFSVEYKTLFQRLFLQVLISASVSLPLYQGDPSQAVSLKSQPSKYFYITYSTKHLWHCFFIP